MTNETIDIRLDQLQEIAVKLAAIGAAMRLRSLSGGEPEALLPGLQLPSLDDLAGAVTGLADDLAWAGKVLEDELTAEA